MKEKEARKKERKKTEKPNDCQKRAEQSKADQNEPKNGLSKIQRLNYTNQHVIIVLAAHTWENGHLVRKRSKQAAQERCEKEEE